MSMSGTYMDVQQRLNEHCLHCTQCRSEGRGLCEEADRLLDELLAASQSREEDEPTWH